MTTKARREALSGPMLTRAGGSPEILSEEERRVRLSFSSETPYERSSWFEEPWVEVLGHDDDEVDMSRLNTGSAPALFGHNAFERLSHVGIVERAWLEKGKGYADIRFSKRDDVGGLWQDIKDGIVRNVSVGYRIDERTLVRQVENGPNEYRVTRWTPMEISMVPIPADSTVGVGRSADTAQRFTITELDKTEDTIMAREEQTITAPDPGVDAAREAAKLEMRAERERVSSILELADRFECGESARSWIADGLSVDQVRAAILEGRYEKQAKTSTGPADIQIVADQRDKTRAGMCEAIEFRAGLGGAPKGNEWVGLSLYEMARDSLRRAGLSTGGSRLEMVGRSFMAHTSADFTYVLENTARKAMLKGYMEAPETYEAWTKRVPMSDFKAHSFVNISTFSDLEEVKENAEYKHGTRTDSKETATLATYGKLFSISRQAIVNDDLSAFTDTPYAMGRAARRKVGDLAYSVLTSNPTMADSNALFSVAHANFVAGGSGAAPSVSTLEAAEVAMAIQTDPGGATLNIAPRYLIVPKALRASSSVLVSAQYDPDTANKLQKPNSILSMDLTVVSDARLDQNDAAKWYLAADPNMFDTVIIGYLSDEPYPMMEQKEGWNVDGVEYKVRIDAVAKATDWRGLYHNDGN